MLSVGKLGPGQEAYYRDAVAEGIEDYYSGRGESAGRWAGSAAGHLDLAGHVEAAMLRAVLSGRDPETDLLEINGEFSLSIVIARCKQTPAGALRWRLRFDTGLNPDITVAVRMDAGNREPLDFYLFPRIDRASEQVRLAEENGLSLDAYRFDTLDLLCDLAAPVRVREAA